MKSVRLIRPLHPIIASVTLPGSKSYTNRALVMAVLADGRSTLHGYSPSRDCEALITALRDLKVEIEELDRDTLAVNGLGTKLRPFNGEIDVGPAGTTMRFLTTICAALPDSRVVLKGSERMHLRPIGDLVNALRLAGARIDYLKNHGSPPLLITSSSEHGLDGTKLAIDGSTSSQFISSILLSAPLFKGGLELEIRGELTSRSYFDMTLKGLSDFGLSFEVDGYKKIKVAAGAGYRARSYKIEGDASGASYLWSLAALSGGAVTVRGIDPLSAQGDVHFAGLLGSMGCVVTNTSDSITVRGAVSELRAIEVDMSLMPDTAQTLAVVAAFARGSTVLRGLHTLRVKETDRIAALNTELAKMGVRSEAGADYLIVHGLGPSGEKPHGGRIATYDDHRMAMSFAVAAAAIDGVVIEEPKVVEKSFPGFFEQLEGMGIGCERS
jgi:3-phosphoshikimate 1-carboxyvinyltransferase